MPQQPELTLPPNAPDPAPEPSPEPTPEYGPEDGLAPSRASSRSYSPVLSVAGPITVITPLEPQPLPAPQSAPRPAPPVQRIPRWMERAELFLRVLIRMYIGLAICCAPWSRTFWDQNPLFAQFPTLSAFAAHGAVRGLVTGLGLLNLWIAFHDAIRHRDS